LGLFGKPIECGQQMKVSNVSNYSNSPSHPTKKHSTQTHLVLLIVFPFSFQGERRNNLPDFVTKNCDHVFWPLNLEEKLVLKWFRAFLASNECPCFCLVLF